MTAPSFGGPWTQQKLEILRRYLDEYTTALKNRHFHLTYVDAFAGAGSYTSATDDYEEFYQLQRGSARIALEIRDKPFDRLLFIEKDLERVESLRMLAQGHPGRDIRIVQDDANSEIPRFCDNLGRSDRAVVFLDPYATQVSWATIQALAASEKIDCWILFPLMAVVRMMPTGSEPNEATANQLDRIFGGREHWQQNYRDSAQLPLLGDERGRERAHGGRFIVDAYKARLESVFSGVASTSRTLKNSKDAPLFELFFAAGNPVGAKLAIRIADYILKHW